MLILCWLLHCLFIMLSVAFFTLFERKVMGLFHNRLGPNKVFFLGLVQPLLDAFKLLSKQNMVPIQANKFTYNSSPMVALFLALFVWLTMPSFYNMLSLNFSLVLFFCVGSATVFTVLLSGWSSNSKYSLIGSLRSVAQSISYESVFGTLLVLVLLLGFSYSIRSYSVQGSLIFLFIFPLWFICSLAETHRAPFDFSESESELVSGFNTEYSGANFAFIFLSEYAILLFSCMLMTYIFFSFFLPYTPLIYMFSTLFLSFLVTWVRITFCRYRYDMLMMFCWKTLLPLTLMILLISIYILI